MRLSKITFGGGLLEGLSLDFSLIGKDSKAARFIVLAGENGTGKTTILNSISALPNNQVGVTNTSELVFELSDFDVQELLRIDSKKMNNSGVYRGPSLSKGDFRNRPKLTLIKKQGQDFNAYSVKVSATKSFSYVPGAWGQNGNTIQTFLNEMVFKLWHNNMEPRMAAVTGISNYEIDEKNAQENIIDLNNGINIPQLLVDLSNKDALDFRNYFNMTQKTDTSLANRRIERFKKAFNGFFDNELVFERVEHNYKVVFRKGDSTFGIDGLSSGEKTIVQCGSSLLKDAGVGRRVNSFILIDEPEQALHPKWQERILDFYADATSLDKSCEPQIFVSTHSEHVLRNAINRDDTLVILLKNNPETKRLEATKMTSDEYLLNYVSYDEIKYRAFGIISRDYHDDLLSYIQEFSGMGCKNQDDELMKEADCPKKHWCGKDRNGAPNPNLDTESLPFYIRHYMHHPELRDDVRNVEFGFEELRESVSFLERYIRERLKR